jgi:hypothetical protein
MKIKTIIFMMIILSIGISSAATYPEAPANIVTVPYLNGAYVEWDPLVGCSNYSVSFSEPTILYANWSELGIAPPTIDGLLDQDVAEFSQAGVLRTPNPTSPTDHAYVFAVYDNDYIYMGADTNDNDASLTDDRVGVCFDFERDGLTDDDVAYRLREDGTFTRFKYNSNSNTWVSWPGSTANFAVGGAGTNKVIYEMRIPRAALPAFTAGKRIDLVIRRTCTEAVEVYTYFPDSTAFSILNTTGWQEMLIGDEIAVPTFTFYTPDPHYDVSGLDSFSWYELSIAGVVNDVQGAYSLTEFITLDYPVYNISGTITNAVTYTPLSNVLVTISDTFTQGSTYSDSNGEYVLEGRHNDTYTLDYTLIGYDNTSKTVVISGDNVSNVDVKMQVSTSYGESENNTVRQYVFLFTILSMAAVLLLGLWTAELPKRGFKPNKGIYKGLANILMLMALIAIFSILLVALSSIWSVP